MLGTQTFVTALLAFFAAGVGSAFPTPAGSKAVMGWFPLAQRGTAMGIRQTGIPLGGHVCETRWVLPRSAMLIQRRHVDLMRVSGMGCRRTLARPAVC